MDFAMLVMWAIAALVVGAGIVSIVGALRRTMGRPAHHRRGGDGGPIYGHSDGGRSDKDNDDGAGDGGGDGGGGD
jgi:hypothetical protein